MVCWNQKFLFENIACTLDNNLFALFSNFVFNFLKEGREEEICEHLDNDLPSEQVPDLSFFANTDFVVILGNVIEHFITLEGSLFDSGLLPWESKFDVNQFLFLSFLSQYPKLFRQSFDRFIFDFFNWEKVWVKIDVLLTLFGWSCWNYQVMVILFFQIFS